MMKNLNIVVDSTNSLVYPDRKVIGINYENLQGYIIFSFKNGFVDGTAWLEIQMPEGTKGYLAMTKEEETYRLPIKSSLLAQKGKIFMNLRVTEGENAEEIPVFKSKVFYQEVLETLNTTTEIPDEYESWIDVANAKLNKIDNSIEKVERLDITSQETEDGVEITFTDKEGQQKTEKVKNGKDGKNAEINGYNTVEIVAGDNVKIEQEENRLKISSTGGGGGQTDIGLFINNNMICMEVE